MMSRVRKTSRQQKSPSPDSDDSMDFGKSKVGRKKPAGSGYMSMLGESTGSPVLIHRTMSGAALPGFTGGGLGASYTIGFKSSQQKSLLQSVVQNIVDIEDDYDRQIQRKKLESDLEVTSERLESLVYEHQDKLHGTLATFDAVDKKIKASQAKVRQVKASLKSCKLLLRCKREELKKLWLDDLKYKHMLQMIESIEEVRAVPERLVQLKSTKHYLAATELLMNSVARLERELSSVEALKELKSELMQQKETLHEELIEELHTHLYVKASSAAAPAPQSGRRGGGDSDVTTSMVQGKKSSTLTRTTQMSMRGAETSVTPPIAEEEGEVDEVGEGQDPQEDSGRYMGVLVQALSSLGRISEALEALHDRMEREFLLIIERASIQVSRKYDQEQGRTGVRRGRGYVRDNVPKLLTKMLKSCFVRFQNVVEAHEVLLGHLNRVKRMYKASYVLYEKSTVWASIQRVVRSALEVYLACDDDGSPGDGLSGFSAFASPGDTQSMFSRRKPLTGRILKKPLFKFDSSRHAISISSYMREQRDLELTGGVSQSVSSAVVHHFDHDQPSIAQHLVCKPHHRNVTVVFRVVRDFIEVVEEELDMMKSNSHCDLYNFLHEYVEHNFLERVRYEYMEKMTGCAKPEAAKVTASDQRTNRVAGSKLCVLNSVLTVWQLVEELRQLMKDLPLYAPHFMDIMCDLLIGYKQSLGNLYSGLVNSPVESHPGTRHGGTASGVQEGVVSSSWATDKEILKNMNLVQGRVDTDSRAGVEEDDGGARNVHHKEAVLLMQKLPEQLHRHNVILSHDNLRLLAIIHESLDWFAGRLGEVKVDLLDLSQEEATDSAAVSKHTHASNFSSKADLQQLVDGFTSILRNLKELAETSLVQLHLEVRCHCFYFLQLVLHKSNYVCSQVDQVEDAPVTQLAEDLKDIDLVMVAVLTTSKYHYLFEGLGHLLAVIFINSTKHITAINTNGIKKMCRNISVLHSCLSKITLVREKELDRARKYFEMLYLSFDEIIEGLHEQGLLYEEDDYQRILRILAHANLQGDKPSDKEEAADILQGQFKQLHDAFSSDTV